MAYRNGTYIAFDGLGQTNPTLSDFRYYATIQAWAVSKNIEFKYVDSHDKTYAVRDASLRRTLEARINERLSNSKNVLAIISSKTRKSGSMLSYEIEKAVDQYQLPLIITYTDYDIVAEPELLSSYWPTALSMRINNETAKAIHIPFIKPTILDAIGQFTCSNLPATSLNRYTEGAYRHDFCCIQPFEPYANRKKSK